MLLKRYFTNLTDEDGIEIVIQFGSSVNGNHSSRFSDIDVAVITRTGKRLKKTFEGLPGRVGSKEMQVHKFSMRQFVQKLKSSDALCLSILHTGKALHGKDAFAKLKNSGFKADGSTRRQCLLNSLAPLSLAISDMEHGMLFDTVNSIYHAARSAIWASLLPGHMTPNNKELLKLVKDREVARLYKRILKSRERVPEYDVDIRFAEKLYEKGNFNGFTQLLDDATKIIRSSHKEIFNQDFISLFDVLEILRKRHRDPPAFYSVFLAVDWKGQRSFYNVFTSAENGRHRIMKIDANTGEYEESLLGQAGT